MKLVTEFFSDKSILSALIILFSLEILMQFGCYKPFLKKNSYARTVHHVMDTNIVSLNTLNPNTLIIGTSIAYEGVSLEILNEELKSKQIIVQSIAIPGSELIVQDLVLKKLFSKENSIHTIIHINDLQVPWIDRTELIDSTLAMITELNTKDAIHKISEDKYNTSWKDYLQLYFKFVSYRKDIGDLILHPDKRIKEMGKEMKARNGFYFYSYDNKYEESLSLYNISSLEDCQKKTNPASPIPVGSDQFHRDAMFRTCTLAQDSSLTLSKNKHTELYKLRLKNLYQTIHSQKIKIINIYPPVPELMEGEKYMKRIDFWEKEYADILSQNRVDLSKSIPEQNNTDYYYDMVHLNRKGKELFTKQLAKKLLELPVAN